MYVGSVVNGPTAAATYYGKVDLGLGQEPTDSNALVLLFTHENGKWKYDQARFFNLTRLPAVKERLKRGDASVLMEQDGFQPLGKIPAVPPVCPPPKYIAKFWWTAPAAPSRRTSTIFPCMNLTTPAWRKSFPED